mgnify:CR=1 FL=1
MRIETFDHMPQVYRQFYRSLSSSLSDSRLITDPLRTLAYGTDASFYRLIPKLVIKTDNEQEVALIIKAAHRLDIPVTFRAAGTSLSGQAVTDSVLVIGGDAWKQWAVLEDGAKIRLQPGIIGAQANRYLAPYGRKIGPDPASINAAMIGGIAANNASGMCCGTAQNSYQTISSLRVVLADGTVLDTGNAASRAAFALSHQDLLEALSTLGREIRANTELAARIHHKFKIKNTMGYSLNALVDFEDPFDIINHLMIGSEGTLGFMSEIVYHTVVEHAHKASALMIFPDIENACKAATILKSEPVAAVELMDRAALRSVEAKPGMPGYLKSMSSTATALLVETRAGDQATLFEQVEAVTQSLVTLPLARPIEFTDKVIEYTRLWDIRKGLFPAVGAVRQIGTTVIIEDVAFPIVKLAPATLELQALMAKYHYDEAIIFGHALEGNLHFVFTQDFSLADEVERYRAFMHDVCLMVVDRYDGSLKAEHGTGRNMAPYLEMEWGREAYRYMEKIKAIFDPKGILNPGVILNPNPQVHIENLKPLPATDAIVDKCIECGFCEAVCPSKNLSLTPRQRIVAQREISRLKALGENPPRLAAILDDYDYQGEATCATDGLCALSCPVDINTGELTKALRRLNMLNQHCQKRADWVANHFEAVTIAMRAGFKAAAGTHKLLGSETMNILAAQTRHLSGDRLPLWNPFMPTAGRRRAPRMANSKGNDGVVYFPACVTRTMGPAMGDPHKEPLPEVTVRVLERAGFTVIFPDDMDKLCCGMAFESKGFIDQADRKAVELERALISVSRDGKYPILCDTSPCLSRMRQVMNGLQLFEPAEFIHDFLLQRLAFMPVEDTVALHPTCSTRKMGLEGKFLTAARACAREVIVPERVDCCGFAGDRGFTHPELNAAALADLREAVGNTCTAGYSNSRTCEIGLSLHSGIYYRSIMYLVDRCTTRGPISPLVGWPV